MGSNSASVLNRLLLNKTQKSKSPPLPINSNALTNTITAHLRSGRLREAVSILFSSTFSIHFSLYAHLFQLCASSKAIVEARKLESHLVSFNPDPPTFLLNRAIETYGKCGCLEDARELFDDMPKRDGGSWNSMISAYSRGGFFESALGLFSGMNRSGILGNEITFAGVLRCCGAVLELCLSRQVHATIMKVGFVTNVILGSSLVDVYGKCGVMSDSRRMFDEIERPNSVTWNVIVRRYLEMGCGEDAFLMFVKMIGKNATPLSFTVSNALVACSSISAIKEGIQIHGFAIKSNFEEDEVVLSSLLDMYAKCGDLGGARLIFALPFSKNLINWTSMVSGYAAKGRTQEVLELFNEMPE